MPPRRIRVFERSTLHIGEQGLAADDIEAIAAFEDRTKIGAFEISYRCVRTLDQVGGVALGDLAIEILPKAEPSLRRDSEALKDKWARALLKMLTVAYDLPLAPEGIDTLKLAREPLLDIVASYFLDLVQMLVHQGLAKGYRLIQEVTECVHGRVIPRISSPEALVHQERLLCEFDSFDLHTVHNMLLARALGVIGKAPVAPGIQRRARVLETCFPPQIPPFTHMRISQATFDSCRYDRRTARYKPAMDLARLILLGFSSTPTEGSTQSLALLFTMHELFERYIRVLVGRAARHRGIEARLQSSKKFWRGIALRPDILLDDGQNRVVLDTKWKVLRSALPDPADLRQMYAYCRFFEAGQSFLVYPRVYDIDGAAASFRSPDDQISCGLVFVDLFEGDHLRKDVGEVLVVKAIGQGSSRA
jgi:5-methylcytosine-specific restriction enzyme subunit McrC